MAAVNGSTSDADNAQATSSHLGKRKRSESPQKVLNGIRPTEFQQRLQSTLSKLESTEAVDALLDQALPTNPADRPESKRARLSSEEEDLATVRQRIQSNEYDALAQVEKDIRNANKVMSDGQNGDEAPTRHDTAASKLLATLSTALRPVEPPAETLRHRVGQVISLRSQTEKGVQQLYSGLRIDTDKPESIDGRRLPNGFDVTDAATMDSSLIAPAKEKRTFGDVFHPKPTTKQLDQPRPRQSNRSTTLNFEEEIPLDKTPIYRNDHKYQSLPTSTWLHYGAGAPSNDPEALKKQRERALTGPDFRLGQNASDSAEEADTLFKKVFSSFAPVSDSSKGLVSEDDRNRAYWTRFGQKRMNKIFKTEYPELEDEAEQKTQAATGNESFDNLAAEFVPSDCEVEGPSKKEPESVDDVLDEVSQLLESVHSYQTIRAVSNRNSDISGNEFDTYEILRSQLNILVSSLPPFAVAKLDGDKLNDLNISTTIIVDGVDFRGTGQPDDYTLQRYRANAQAAQPARPPPPPQQPARPPYTPAPVQRYNTSYGQPAQQTAYQQRPTTNYQQPATAQKPYQPNSYNPQTALQQFQRPTQNGYNYNSQTPANYTQTPSQPGYQQRAQAQAMAFNRTASPPKPIMNGQTPYYPPAPYQRSPQTYSPTPHPIPPPQRTA